MSSSELVDWIAEDRIEPIGPIRDDYRAGVIASALVAMNTTSGKSPGPLDWFPWFVKDEGEVIDSPEEVSAGVIKFIEEKTKRG